MDTADGPVVLVEAVRSRRLAVGERGRHRRAMERRRAGLGAPPAGRRGGLGGRRGRGPKGGPVGQELQAGSFIERWLIR